MENLEQMNLTALDAVELQQVQGGVFFLAVLAATAVITMTIAIVETRDKPKEVKLLQNVPRIPK
jgi:hypothetical protein